MFYQKTTFLSYYLTKKKKLMNTLTFQLELNCNHSNQDVKYKAKC
jgi:hypothetical protein